MKTNGSTASGDALNVIFVLDASGSMTRLARSVVAGFDEFVTGLRGDGGSTRFSLTQFDTRFRHVHVARPLAAVPSRSQTGYRPGGMTALFDAVAHSVLETDRRLIAEGCADEKVMVVVMTDGLENASTDYTEESLVELIRGFDERPNWTFVYLGAAHGSVEEAADVADAMAFKRSNAMRWDAEDVAVRKSMSALASAASVRRASSRGKTDALFEEAQQTERHYDAS